MVFGGSPEIALRNDKDLPQFYLDPIGSKDDNGSRCPYSSQRVAKDESPLGLLIAPGGSDPRLVIEPLKMS